MKFYLAPMEGITGYIYRNAYREFFGGVDKYFTPFITTNQNYKLKPRDLNDILPEHNRGIAVVPQILTNHAGQFVQLCAQLKDFGYDEINLNLGCPSGTVVAKGKGSGFLAKKDALDAFLAAIFEQAEVKISIKTRIGKDVPEEAGDLIRIYNQYPLEELIVHPRVQKDYYNNKPNLAVFRDVMSESRAPVCYNGDIFTVADYQIFTHEFPEVEKVMLGRGILAHPAMPEGIRGEKEADMQRIKVFHDRLCHDYQEVLSGDRDVLFKMKELWSYMIFSFPGGERYLKKIRKAERLCEYRSIVESLFACEIPATNFKSAESMCRNGEKHA